jgi:ubiquinol-cytochrome c reductase cytochrome c1 subunit
MRTKFALTIALLFAAGAALAADAEGGHGKAAAGYGHNWQEWHADNEVTNIASLQRGASYFMSYCQGCHALKYMRYSRLGEDLVIPPEQLEKFLLPPGEKASNYILTSMPQADAEAWFGKPPPDLSLMARARGVDYLYQFLKTFYVDPAKPTGVNNLRLDSTAMPHVLSSLEGLKRAVFKEVEEKGADGATIRVKEFQHFETVAPGAMSAADYDAFVRDLVNFLDYVSEPTQAARRALGIWVVLFLLLFTWFAWSLKKEYWKDVH